MNVGFVACIILVVLFLVLGILFAILKEKGADVSIFIGQVKHLEFDLIRNQSH